MPCKTVIMPTDCIYINSIYYRHMIGRAGRRGFDTIGNIGMILKYVLYIYMYITSFKS
jgi:replicative superfamily II helicase